MPRFGLLLRNDIVQSEAVRSELEAYAFVRLGRRVEVRFGHGFEATWDDALIIDPRWPSRNTPPEDRLIACEGGLEHLLAHALHFPRELHVALTVWPAPWRRYRVPVLSEEPLTGDDILHRFKTTCPYLYAPSAEWMGLGLARYSVQKRTAVLLLVNLLADGHDERLLYAETPGAYERIVAVDGLRPRWLTQPARDDPWCQLTGALLLHALPLYEPPLDQLSPRVRRLFEQLAPLVEEAVAGSYADVLRCAFQLVDVCERERILPRTPRLRHLRVGAAVGRWTVWAPPGYGDQDEPAGMGPGSNGLSRRELLEFLPEQLRLQDEAHPAARPEDRKPGARGVRLPATQLPKESPAAVLERRRAIARAILERLHPLEAEPRFSFGAITARLRSLFSAAPGSAAQRRPPPSPEASALYARDLSAVLPEVRAFVSQIERIITEPYQTQRFQRSGRLDRSRLVAAMLDDERIYWHRRRVRKLDIAFSLCIDTSASIAPQAAELQRAAILTQAALERLRIPYEVRGFGAHQICYKRFDEHSPHRLGALARNVGGGTPMLAAIQQAVHSLQARPEETRILFVICDGAPFERAKVVQAVHEARAHGIRPFCVVLNGVEVSDIFGDDWVAIEHVSEIPNVVGHKLRESLRHHHHA